METSDALGFKDLFNSLNSTLVILPPDPEETLVVSALSLHLSLKNSGKVSQIGYSGNLPNLVGIKGLNDLKNSIGQKNLHINLNFLESNLDRVDYEVDQFGKFSLVIHAKDGVIAPDPNQIEYTFSGAEADLVILLGIENLEELGAIYAKEKRFLDRAKKLLITNSPKPQNLSNNLLQDPNRSYPEMIASLIRKADLSIDTAIADNLVSSIYKSTDNLSGQKSTPETFETIAFLLRQGANIPASTLPVQHSSPTAGAFPQPPFFLKPPAKLPGDLTKNSENGSVPTDWQAPKIFRSGS